MPSLPSFDPTLGDTVVPRERRGAPRANSSSDPAHLTPGPSVVSLRTLAEEPTVAHIPESDDSGYMAMYARGRTVTVDDRSAWPKKKTSGLPTF